MAEPLQRLFDLGFMDTLSRQQTGLHQLDARAKLITVLVFVIIVVSFDKYSVSALLPFLVFPIALLALGNIPFLYIARKIAFIAPLAVLIGVFNPVFDRETMMRLGPLDISGGWVSFASIILRFCLAVSACLALVAVTGFFEICGAMQALGMPRPLVVQLMFLYRYSFVLIEQTSRAARARSLRSFGRRGTGIKSYGSLVGHLLLRTLDRAERIYRAMCARGFDGKMPARRQSRIRFVEIAFVFSWSVLLVSLRLWNVPRLIGELALELIQ